MHDQQKQHMSHLRDEQVHGSLAATDTVSHEIVDVLNNGEKIVEVQNIDNLGFLEVITTDPHYKEAVEPYSKRAQKAVEYAIGEAVDNVVKHGLKSVDTDPASKLAVLKSDHPEYEEVNIVTENFFKKDEVNETGGGIEKFIERIETINKKSIEELDAEYREEVLKGTDSLNTHGGGNLGFIDMARKIKKMYNNTLDNIFKAIITPINDHIAKLTMIIRIPIPKSV